MAYYYNPITDHGDQLYETTYEEFINDLEQQADDLYTLTQETRKDE